ncbi:MAG: LPS export ABC transporter permease LptF [Bdellovibrionaceae bacterium]|nr:LPS export ABC transporter permease LptF [Pseudobdellovibrionaceae bacterium]
MVFFRGKKAFQYIFFETLPSFILGLLVFVFIILMFQVLRLTEFALIHGVEWQTLAQIIIYITISMLPILFPMSLLFSILLTYGRLSQDSEIVAMKASGLSMKTILAPALFLALLISIISGQTSFELAPWGNRQFEVLFTKLGNTKAAATIKEGTFSEGFFDLVVYSNEVNSETGELKHVFIYNERDADSPITIIAKKGELIPDPLNPGHKVLLRLYDGTIHKRNENHTKIKFESSDLQLIEPVRNEFKEKSPQSMTLDDLRILKDDMTINEEDQRLYQVEFHKRWAISVLCIVFAIVGVGLGIDNNRREQKTSGFVLSILVIIIYWILYVTLEGFARSKNLSPALAIWLPNILFGIYGLRLLKKQWK